MGSEVMAKVKQLEPWNRLDGKVVLVTGASSGLGRGFCLDLAKAGCKIIAAARRMDRLESLCHQVNHSSFIDAPAEEAINVRAVAVELDVTAEGATIEDAVQRAWDAFGTIDVLINNAGVRGGLRTSVELSEEEWENTYRTNIRGAWMVAKYVCRKMMDAGKGGSIINISSITGLDRVHTPGGAAYASSKAAMHNLTKMMALELGQHKIRVNAVAPGVFPSEITEELVRKDWLKNVARRTVPLQTFGEIDPGLTSLIRYLIHDSSEYVSGNIFIVDAGYTLPGVPIFSSL
ncbi:3-oxoacyl-[acyl-carrier-protein] reductase [Bertholletia excelsa]